MKQTLKHAEQLGLTVKNIKTFEGHDTMQGFNATVYLNGKKAFHAYEAAHGGCMEYRVADGNSNYREVNDLIQELEEKLKTFPKYKTTLGTKEYDFQDNLDCVIDALVSRALEDKQIARDSKKGILIEIPNGYSILKFKAGTITAMLKKYKQEAVATMLQGHVAKELKAGSKILNLEYLKSIGVKA